ncbi:hypothetical protein OI450_06515 [Pectobacterium cacticida]|uniref:Uncharacterized protein n=1 Tax=Pectobacterium cacticida TaxID=69221 RepID=A0ABZ2G9S7_9GAMM|nr:hypothetical protein [Pectobacterium cacticida]UYX08014.1 hypothetical protein OI450_06515 [Pectobacterium cacticida]
MPDQKITNVIAAFDKIKTTPEVRRIAGFNTKWKTDAYHMQGMARHDNYYFFTHNDIGNDGALIYVADITKNDYNNTIKTNTGRFNHPGGCQIVDNYLITASQEHTFLTSKYEDTQLALFDISDPSRSRKKVLWENEKISCMAAAMTRIQDNQNNTIYFVMAYESGTKFHFFSCHIPGTIDKSSIQKITLKSPDSFKGYAAQEGKNIQNFNLISDNENRIYMVEFATSGSDNYLYLSLIEWDGATNQSIMVSTPLSYKKLSMQENASFDYGAGLYCNNEKISVFACGRNSVNGMLIVNEF